MTGQINMYWPEIQQARGKILFHFICFFPLLLNCRNQWTTIDNGDFKTLHGSKLTILN